MRGTSPDRLCPGWTRRERERGVRRADEIEPQSDQKTTELNQRREKSVGKGESDIEKSKKKKRLKVYMGRVQVRVLVRE